MGRTRSPALKAQGAFLRSIAELSYATFRRKVVMTGRRQSLFAPPAPLALLLTLAIASWHLSAQSQSAPDPKLNLQPYRQRHSRPCDLKSPLSIRTGSPARTFRPPRLSRRTLRRHRHHRPHAPPHRALAPTISACPACRAESTTRPSTSTPPPPITLEVKTPQQFQQLILSLLEDRFQLKFHREQKEGPVYWRNSTSPENSAPPSSKHSRIAAQLSAPTPTA